MRPRNKGAYRDLIRSLDQLNRNGLYKYITDLDAKEPTVGLDTLLSRAVGYLLSCWRHYIFDAHWKYLQYFEHNATKLLLSIRHHHTSSLADYFDYLHVKCVCNVTVSAFRAEMPGLLSFLYVDRSTNEIIFAPTETTANVLQQTDNNLGNDHQTTRMVTEAYESLSKGTLTSVWEDGGLQFSYYFWFEDKQVRKQLQS